MSTLSPMHSSSFDDYFPQVDFTGPMSSDSQYHCLNDCDHAKGAYDSVNGVVFDASAERAPSSALRIEPYLLHPRATY